MAAYELQSSEVVYDGDLSNVRIDRIRMPDGSVAEREIVEHPDAVAVVAIDGDGKVVLLRQYRPALRTRVLEIPAGKMDVDGETPMEAARRELIEEVGLDAGSLSELVTFVNSGGWCDEHTTVYLAGDLTDASAPDSFVAKAEEADLEVVRMPIAHAVQLAQSGEITDAKTLIGLLIAGAQLS